MTSNIDTIGFTVLAVIFCIAQFLIGILIGQSSTCKDSIMILNAAKQTESVELIKGVCK